jgi:hypothetical protein
MESATIDGDHVGRGRGMPVQYGRRDERDRQAHGAGQARAALSSP